MKTAQNVLIHSTYFMCIVLLALSPPSTQLTIQPLSVSRFLDRETTAKSLFLSYAVGTVPYKKSVHSPDSPDANISRRVAHPWGPPFYLAEIAQFSPDCGSVHS
jgi:hypothetical protein